MPSLSSAATSSVTEHPTAVHAGNAKRALFLGGFGIFMTLYCVQPLLPLFSREFHLSAAESSWSLSISTGALAACLLVASVMSDRLGRTSMMTFALFASAISTIACAAVGGFGQLLVLRAFLGVALAGLPAVAMTYLSEEIAPTSLGYATGLYIAGSALGGMAGRVVGALLADLFSWRAAMGVVGLVALLIAFEFRRRLPPSRHFHPRVFDLRATTSAALRHFGDAGLRRLFLSAFLLMGTFVSAYNFLGYRLLSPHFSVGHTGLSLIYALYVVGMFSSVAMGRLADRFGRRGVMWITVSVMLTGLLATLVDNLVAITVGISLFTFGFFGAHSVASSWVGRRVTEHRAIASAIYLFAYYLGSSLVSPLAGTLWEVYGWTGIVMALGACLSVCLLIAVDMKRIPPNS